MDFWEAVEAKWEMKNLLTRNFGAVSRQSLTKEKFEKCWRDDDSWIATYDKTPKTLEVKCPEKNASTWRSTNNFCRKNTRRLGLNWKKRISIRKQINFQGISIFVVVVLINLSLKYNKQDENLRQMKINTFTTMMKTFITIQKLTTRRKKSIGNDDHTFSI